MEYYIFATNDCNLNCRYCSVLLRMEEAGMPQNPEYSLDNLNKFIDTMQKKYSDKVADIVFFGGEPTLNYSFIERVITSQKNLPERPYEFHYMLHTNGLLLQKIPDNILKSLNSIMLSINYDKVPHNQLNSGYFKTIVDSIHYVRKASNISIVARLTITEDTSLYSEIALLNPFFDAIYWQLENKKAFTNFDTFYSSYRYELELVFSMWLSYLRKGILIRLIPFMASIYFLPHRKLPTSFCCGYNCSMVYIQTDGHCYTCAEDMTSNQNLIGKIDGDVNFSNFGLSDTVCYTCKYVHMCMGRCGRMHKEFSQNHVQEYCKLNRILFDLIIAHYDEIKNYCNQYGIVITLDDPIYHYTEYTP